jgi:RNA polymerase sigma-70 factor, ECF subfamily
VLQANPENPAQIDGTALGGAAHTLRQARAGERGALHRLLSPHQPALFGLCRNILGTTEDAEDAVQETFLLAIRALDRFRGTTSEIKTWLYRIAINLCLQEKRTRARRLSLQTDPCAAPPLPSLEHDALTRAQLDAALASLLPRHRAVFLLREWNGCSVTEIAQTMQCTQRRVNNDLVIARRTLQVWAQQQRREEDTL